MALGEFEEVYNGVAVVGACPTGTRAPAWLDEDIFQYFLRLERDRGRNWSSRSAVGEDSPASDSIDRCRSREDISYVGIYRRSIELNIKTVLSRLARVL